MWPHLARWLMTLALGILVTPLGAHAQLAGKVPRIGIVGIEGTERTWEVFRHTMRDLGYVDGQNLVLESRFVGGQQDQTPQGLAELISLKVDILLTAFTGATLAAHQATRTLPIVFVNQPNPVEYGLVASLAHPGGNLTGVANVDTESVMYKLLQMLKEIVPDATRLDVLANPDSPPYLRGLKILQAVTAAFGLQMHVLEVWQIPEDLEQALAAIAREPPHALYIGVDPLFIAHRAQIVDLAAKSGLPAVYMSPAFVRAGDLLSYTQDNSEASRRVAVIVDKVLHGAKPADVPVEQPTKYHLAINLKTASAQGLTIPPGLLVLADEVLQ